MWIPARLGGNLSAYLASLTRILALNPKRMLPAHGAVIDSPARVLRDYIAHRLEREEQVIAALRAGATALKLVPADAASPAVLKALVAVIPAGTRVLPVGGIAPDNIGPWLTAGAAGFARSARRPPIIV